MNRASGIIVAACIPLLAWSSWRLLTYNKTVDPGPFVDVYHCSHEKKEIPFSPEQMATAYRENTFESNGSKLLFKCPGCGNMSLEHDKMESFRRTMKERGQEHRIPGYHADEENN